MNNYEFCARWVQDQRPSADARVLDYGCGAGQIVDALRQRGITAFGCDVFYDGGDYSSQVHAERFASGVIRRIEDGRIPFDDASFDFVINNQVMEHVEDLDAVLREIARVLKPGGIVLSLFPDRGVWREGHCGIPLLHWFAKGSRLRVHYAVLMRLLGFGYFTGTKTRRQWSEDFCLWLDQWAHYRSLDEIRATYARHLGSLRHREEDWLARRLEGSPLPLVLVPRVVQRLVVRKLGGLVFEAQRAPSSG